MYPIHIVGVCGSPRDQGTEAVLEEALRIAGAFEDVTTSQINLRELDFKFCTHCNLCLEPDYYSKHGYRCVHNDDLEKIYPLMLKADGYIFATPVYAGNPSGLFWSFFNRLRPINQGIVDRNKTIQFIAVGGSYRNGTDSTQMALMRIVMHGKFLYVPSGHFECVGVQVVNRNPPDKDLPSGRFGALHDEIGMKAVREMARRMIKHTKLIKAGEKALGIVHEPWNAPTGNLHKGQPLKKG
ncbi:MAG: flavodoxin family protein [Candidatus Ranarchaeia archaeon]